MSPRLSGNLVTQAAVVLWATSFPATEALLASWHPLPLVAARLAISALSLSIMMVLAGQAGFFRRLPWRDVALFGGLGLGAGTVFLVWGQDYSNPVSVAIIVTTLPLVSAVMGFALGQERITAMITLGIACAIAGGILASLPPEGASLDFRGGEFLVVGSVLLFTWYSRASVTRLAALPDLTKTAVTMMAATVVVTLASGAVTAGGTVEARYDLSPTSIGLLVWVGFVSNGLSMFLWLVGARKLGVTIAAIHLNAVPFYVILIALILGGTLYVSQVWGACLVALGALLAQLPAFRRARQAPAPD
jgi:drug/metabolite transporter (DMT)-like permease